MLLQLRSLRSSRIDRGENRLGNPSEIGEMLKQLSNTLQALEIFCLEVQGIFVAEPSIPNYFQETYVNQTSLLTVQPDTVMWDLSESFPNLTRLHLEGDTVLRLSDFVSLPIWLETLIMDCISRCGTFRSCHEDYNIWKSFLLVQPPSADKFAHLPWIDLFVDFKWNKLLCYSVAALPRTLREIGNQHFHWNQYYDNAFPSLVKHLQLSSLDLTFSWDHLRWSPQSLVSLTVTMTLRWMGRMIQLLPVTLKTLLIVNLYHDDLKRSHWPPNLKTLIVTDDENEFPDEFIWPLFPRTLTHLEYNYCYCSTLLDISYMNMPQLEFLQMTIDDNPEEPLPPSFSLPTTLTSLKLDAYKGDRLITDEATQKTRIVFSKWLCLLPQPNRLTSLHLVSSYPILRSPHWLFRNLGIFRPH